MMPKSLARGDRFRGALAVPVILRELALLGGLVALFLAPVRPEHWAHLPLLLGGFAAYKLGGLAVAWHRLYWLPRVRLTTRTLDYLFVFLLIWFTGGTQSHFYLLYNLLVSLDAYESGHRGGLAAATAAAALYAGDHALEPNGNDWTHVASRAGLFFILGTALGWLSDRERAARAATEQANQELETALHQLHVTQDKLVQSERLATVGQMTSKIAHEIRNPLGAITLNLGLLEETLPAQGEASHLLAATKEQVQALSSVTEEYLQFSRLARPHRQQVDPAPLLGEVAELMEPELVARGARLVLEVERPLPAMRADPRLVRQALINLIKNAAEAVKAGGTVWVGAAAMHSAIEFWVADDGPGVSAPEMSRIFEPFYTTKPGGTGLGLAVVQQVALDHGGTIHCESHPGHGARFVLRLPLHGPERSEEAIRA